MSEGGRVGDPIAHSSALGGLLTGLAVGAAVAIGVVAIVGSGGLAAVVMVGAGIAGGARVGEVIGGLASFSNDTGKILDGSPNVFINGRPAALAHESSVGCDKHGIQRIAEGSSNVFINGRPVARKGDRSTCGGKISSGSPNVFIGGATAQTDEIDPEVPDWLRAAIFAIGLGSTGIALFLGVGVGLVTLGVAGGIAGDKGGDWIGGKAFGEGSDGQKLMALGGSILGGLLGGGWGGKRFDTSNPGLTKALRRFYLNKKYGRSGNLHWDIDYRANEKAAYNFFKSNDYAEKTIEGYMKAFNFNKSVQVVTVNSGKKLWQYQVPGASQGRWYSLNSTTKPTELGISAVGTKAKIPKILNTYTTTQKVEVLRSTAAPAKDNWSVPRKSYSTKGGALQLFTHDNSAFRPTSQ